MTNRGRHFRRGGGGTFKCDCCGRSTRLVEQGNPGLCTECWELAGLDNSVNDGAQTLDEVTRERDGLAAYIVKHGGDIEAVKRENSYLWPKAK